MRRSWVLTAAALAMTLSVAEASAATALERTELSDSFGGLIAAQRVCGLKYDPVAMHSFMVKNVPAKDHAFMQRVKAHSADLEQQAASWPAVLRTNFCSDNLRVARQYGF